jgi:drug/metabolite transporter (DMT)-like permease
LADAPYTAALFFSGYSSLMTTRSAEGLMVLVTFVAAAGWLFTRHALHYFTPYTFVGVRFALAGVVLALFCVPELKRMPLRQHLLAIGSGCVQGAAMLVWIHAMAEAELIGEGAFIVSLSVVFMPLMGRIIFGDHISLRLLAVLPVSIAGLALLSLDHGLSLRPSQWGFLISSVGFSLHLLVSAHFARSLPAMPLATWQLLVGGVFGLTAALVMEPFNLAVQETGWIWLLLSAFIASSLRFAMQMRAIRYLTPTQIGMILLLEPVWVVFLSAWLLGERMPFSKIAGCTLIFASLLIYRVKWPVRKTSA